MMCGIRPRTGRKHSLASARGSWFRPATPRKGLSAVPRPTVISIIGAILSLPAVSAQAQRGPSEPVECAETGQPLVRIPELRSSNGKLRATIVLGNGWQRMNLRRAANPPCVGQDVRQFRGVDTVPAEYPGVAPDQPAPPASRFADPVPGPTLRAQVGDIVQLTFLNQIETGGFWKTLDRGERGEGCDRSSNRNPLAAYPGPDQFPDCFHGSSTGNIHFHGSHTNPSTTGDNIFVEVRPSLRGQDGKPLVTEKSVAALFGKFFSDCEAELGKNVLSQWPRLWGDLPQAWANEQENLLKQYDQGIVNKLWPANEAQIKTGAWPQYHIGAYPYCFRLPAYTASAPAKLPDRPPAQHATNETAATPAHVGAALATGTNPPAATGEGRSLRMGQAPGLHWYHAHKHGSTTINVADGMTGAFIIEGQYDLDLNAFYGANWTRTQPLLVINQLGTVPNMFAGAALGVMPLSVNGRLQPKLTMRPGEVQLWRIANTSSRSGLAFVGMYTPATPPQSGARAPFEWKQIAQDGVQFAEKNYDDSKDKPFLMAAGNRVDLLVKAPENNTGQPQVFNVLVRGAINSDQAQKESRSETLMTVQVEPGSPVTGNRSKFIAGPADYPAFPKFLNDIGPNEVKSFKTITFESSAPNDWPANAPVPFTMHSIDGRRFDGNIGEVVLLNTTEEWKVENRTTSDSPSGRIDHPFHIHINPFQVVEVFDPNMQVPNAAGQLVPKFVFYKDGKDPAQCYLDPFKPDTWRDCNPVTPTNVWWDVFPIPSGIVANSKDGTPIIDPKTQAPVIVPGYFKMRSRFVDYAGLYVIHCHILAHEDRGMMTVVQVVPYTTAYSHR